MVATMVIPGLLYKVKLKIPGRDVEYFAVKCGNGAEAISSVIDLMQKFD